MSKRVEKSNRCCAMVADPVLRCTLYQCQRRAAVTESGKGYCKQHAPSSVKARRDKWNEKFEAESKARDAKWKAEEKRELRRDECESAFAGIPNPERFVAAARRLAAALDEGYLDTREEREALDAFRACDRPST